MAYARDAEDPTYKDAPKTALRDALWAEQHGLCAYCEGPLKAGRTRIEHWAPQSEAPERQLDYRNLLLCCDGNAGCGRAELFHCDVRKGNTALTLNPTDERIEHRVTFGRTGVQVLGGDAQAEVDDVLGLNVESLLARRRELVQGLQRQMSLRFKGRPTSKVWLERAIARLEATPRPFGRSQLAYLRDRLRRLP
ncbi:MAG: TIGR02646 family protein [Myxococcales bacterium]|nr:TIGR02646 family protein [Myxococcales bacterium]